LDFSLSSIVSEVLVIMMVFVSSRIVMFSLLVAPSCALKWPSMQHDISDIQPNVEISLAPALHPWPQVGAELGDLESKREQMENTNMVNFQQEVNKATADARRQIGDIVSRAFSAFAFRNARVNKQSMSASFLKARLQDAATSASSVKINVVAASPPDASVRDNIEDLEKHRSDSEANSMSLAISQLTSLSHFVQNELQAQLQEQLGRPRISAMSLRQLRSSQANFRVVPTGSIFPTVSSMVQDMQQRRDVAEDLEHRMVLNKQLDFLMACNSFIKDALRKAVAEIQATSTK